MSQKITKAKIIADLQSVAEELDKDNISMDDYREHGSHAIDTVLDRFDKWNHAKEAAGLVVNERDVSHERLLLALRDMYIELERAPTEEDMDKYGPFSSTTYQRKFGSWLMGLRMARDVIPEFDFNPSRHTPAAQSVPS